MTSSPPTMSRMMRQGSSSSAEPAKRTATHRLLAGIAIVIVVFTTIVAPVSAESPTKVAEELSIDGVFVAPGRDDIVEADLVASVDRAQALGLRLVVVAPADPQPNSEAFARRIQEAADVDAAIVFPPDGGFEAHSVDEFKSNRLRAVSAARSKANPLAAVDAYYNELLVEPERGLPPIIRQLTLIVLLLAVVLAAVVVLDQVLRRAFGRGRNSRRRVVSRET